MMTIVGICKYSITNSRYYKVYKKTMWYVAFKISSEKIKF